MGSCLSAKRKHKRTEIQQFHGTQKGSLRNTFIFFKYSLVVPDNIHSNMTFEYYEYNTRLAMPPDRRTMTLDFLSPNKNLP